MNFPKGNNYLSVENLADKKLSELSSPYANLGLAKDFLWITFLFVTAQRNLDTLFANKVVKLASIDGVNLLEDNDIDIKTYLDKVVSIFEGNVDRDAKNFSKQYSITAKKHEVLFKKLLLMSKVNSFLVADSGTLTFGTHRIAHSFNDSDVSEFDMIKMCDDITLTNLGALDAYAASTIFGFASNKDSAVKSCRTRALELENNEISKISRTEVAAFTQSNSDDCVGSIVDINSLMITLSDRTIADLISDLQDNGTLFIVNGDYNIAKAQNCALVNAITKGDQL